MCQRLGESIVTILQSGAEALVALDCLPMLSQVIVQDPHSKMCVSFCPGQACALARSSSVFVVNDIALKPLLLCLAGRAGASVLMLTHFDIGLDALWDVDMYSLANNHSTLRVPLSKRTQSAAVKSGTCIPGAFMKGGGCTRRGLSAFAGTGSDTPLLWVGEAACAALPWRGVSANEKLLGEGRL